MAIASRIRADRSKRNDILLSLQLPTRASDAEKVHITELT